MSPEQAARFAKAFGHPPSVLVQLALQDSVRESGLKLKVTVEAASFDVGERRMARNDPDHQRAAGEP